MSKIGIFDVDQFYLNSEEESIKSDILLFDKIHFIYKEPLMTKWFPTPNDCSDVFRTKMAEIEELERAGLITEFPDPFKDTQITIHESNLINFNINPIIQTLPININEEGELLISKAKELDTELYLKTMNDMEIDLSTKNGFLKYWIGDRFVRQFVVRLYASHFRYSDTNSEFIPIIRGELNREYLAGSNIKYEVLKIISKKMPKISSSISINAIIDFKNDSDTQTKYLALRNFINDLSISNFSIPEMEEKLEYLLNDYENRLRLHRIKYNLTTVETVVTTTGYLLENLLKLKFGEIAKMFFSFRKDNIQLMQSELDLQGKEIAFINKANESFGS